MFFLHIHLVQNFSNGFLHPSKIMGSCIISHGARINFDTKMLRVGLINRSKMSLQVTWEHQEQVMS